MLRVEEVKMPLYSIEFANRQRMKKEPDQKPIGFEPSGPAYRFDFPVNIGVSKTIDDPLLQIEETLLSRFFPYILGQLQSHQLGRISDFEGNYFLMPLKPKQSAPLVKKEPEKKPTGIAVHHPDYNYVGPY